MLNLMMMSLSLFLIPNMMKPMFMLILSFLMFSKLMFIYGVPFVMSPLLTLDQLSSPLISLTIWISALMIMAGFLSSYSKSTTALNSLIIILMIVLILSFSVNNIMHYYILFEMSLIPTLVIILGWGYQPERLQASMYLMLYTITASLPLLAGLMYYINTKQTMFMLTSFNASQYSQLLYIMMIMAFMVKMPMYLTHLWLPKAHVEAPIAGSMILAGILLKLGAYGIMRVMYMMKGLSYAIQDMFVPISMWGAVMTSIICLRQQDMKSLIAYSSVGHMALLIAGLFSTSSWAYNGGMIMALAHGLSSPALFSLANINYELNNSRSLLLAKGLMFLAPPLAIWWFIMSIANMAAPPTLNLIGEILLMVGIIFNNSIMGMLFALSSFLAAMYSLMLYTSIIHGKPLTSASLEKNILHRNSTLSLFHALPLFITSLAPFMLMPLS